MRQRREVRLVSENDTADLAKGIARNLRIGDLIALDGQLGAGKTTFVRHLVDALGGDAGMVSSPTYTLLNSYAASMMVHHVDAYRLRDLDELLGLGIEESLEDGCCCIEWAQRITGLEQIAVRCWYFQWNHAEHDARLVRYHASVNEEGA